MLSVSPLLHIPVSDDDTTVTFLFMLCLLYRHIGVHLLNQKIFISSYRVPSAALSDGGQIF